MERETAPLVISASRRTDIPNHYASWFFQRLREQYVLVRNVRDFHQVRRIDLSPGAVACFVFWSKNPAPLMERLDELSAYPYYIHYTITGYGADIEPRIPPIGESVDRFRQLADRIGHDRIIWRYDPVFISKSYPVGYHVESFSYIARKLEGYTTRCVFSFMDTYRNTEAHAGVIAAIPLEEYSMRSLVANFASETHAHGMEISTCAEPYDFADLGIAHGSCVDPVLVERLSGYSMTERRDKGQRPHCRCAPSVDIGMYNTCLNLCAYCYANYSQRLVHGNYAQARSGSPLLVGTLGKGDMVDNRPVSVKGAQLSLFGKPSR